jgi:DNA-binding NtrC family response regulator
MQQEELVRPKSDLDSLAGRDRQKDSHPQSTIVVLDHDPIRLEHVNAIASKAGARAQCLQNLTAIRNVRCTENCSIALVALWGPPKVDNPSVDAIRVLTRKGFKVVSYEERTSRGSLDLRCQALLAGCVRLLDSSDSGFPQEVERVVEQLLTADATRRKQEQEIRALMAKMGVVGESVTMITVFRWVLRVSALSDLPVLIMGETGTGKQIIAEAIHRLDPKRWNGPFVTVNCGAISPGLAETELFGHRRGAYTGAEKDRKGLIRSAQGGILFLDEVGELEQNLQVKLLRVLQESRVLVVGEDQEVPIDVRIVAATNRDLNEMVQGKMFRADLYHRLNVLSVHMPPLRERLGDLKLLIQHFLTKYQVLARVNVRSVDPDFMEALARLPLPGNIRQLENLIRRVLLDKDEDTSLNITDLPPEVWQQLSNANAMEWNRPSQEDSCAESQTEPGSGAAFNLVGLLKSHGWNLSRSLQECEKSMVQAAMHMAKGNQVQTAKLLGITPRSVYNKVHKHHLHF